MGIRPPIFREVVLRDVGEKYETTEKGEMKNYFCEREDLVRKRVTYGV